LLLEYMYSEDNIEISPEAFVKSLTVFEEVNKAVIAAKILEYSLDMGFYDIFSSPTWNWIEKHLMHEIIRDVVHKALNTIPIENMLTQIEEKKAIIKLAGICLSFENYSYALLLIDKAIVLYKKPNEFQKDLIHLLTALDMKKANNI